MKTFEGLEQGTVITNSIDGDMIVCYSDAFSENGEKEFCLASGESVWRGCQFDPAEWEIKKADRRSPKTSLQNER